jgi:hypothetical protein
MKPFAALFLLVALIFPAAQGLAETDVHTLETLLVEFWPDYDRASVLVLLTGSLPEDVVLPARVGVPFPETARLNAVARIDARDGLMKDDILASPGPGELDFITPDRAFRVEYYMPYTAEGTQRSFDFTWQSGLSVARFRVKVQQPAAADAFHTEPAAGSMVRDEHGLNYAIFPDQSMPAGQLFHLHADYRMDQPRLSAQNDQVQTPGPTPPLAAAHKPAASGIPWPFLAMIAGGVLVILAVLWMAVTRRSGRLQ